MTTIKQAAGKFLSHRRIAVAGVSRHQNSAANIIYRKLRAEGYKVFAVNPNAQTVEGDECYPNLKSIPQKPEAVVIVTRPEVTKQIVRECAELGIANVWMHRGVDAKGTSVSDEAVDFCHRNGISVIPGGCPMMYCSNADTGHKIMRWLQGLTGKLPQAV